MNQASAATSGTAPRFDRARARLACHAVVDALVEDEKTRDPMNALVVWTELGRGLSGTLDKKGAEPGKLRGMITTWCRTSEIDGKTGLERWTYKLPIEQRLDAKEVGAAMRRVMKRLEEAMPDLTAAAEADGDKSRELFLVVVRGWFAAGQFLFDRLAGRSSSREQTLAALGAWCERYLPKDDSTPRELGVRVVRQ